MAPGAQTTLTAKELRKKKKQAVKKRRQIEKRREARRIKLPPGAERRPRVSQRMQKVFRKRARDYNSDDDDDGDADGGDGEGEDMEDERFEGVDNGGGEAGPLAGGDGEASDEEDEHGTGFTKFVQGVNAFRAAFQAIMNIHVDDEPLGPVLSSNKKLVVEKLAEEMVERKAKGEAKKQKHLIEEKGHTKPANFLDAHEKLLIGVATKGVVKLFNAVNKAQNAQKGLNPSRFKDAKVLTKRRKEAFLSELSKASGQTVDTTSKGAMANGGEDNTQPAWAPLRDTFMLTNSKLKDWDKMEEQTDDL